MPFVIELNSNHHKRLVVYPDNKPFFIPIPKLGMSKSASVGVCRNSARAKVRRLEHSEIRHEQKYIGWSIPKFGTSKSASVGLCRNSARAKVHQLEHSEIRYEQKCVGWTMPKFGTGKSAPVGAFRNSESPKI
jgi:hypothetical protein